MTGLLEGKNVLITGVITEASMAFHTARIAMEQGATVVLTGFGRVSLVERIAKRLPGAGPSSSWTSRTPSRWRRWPSGSASTWTAWTACCTRSASPRRPRSAAVFLDDRLGGRRDRGARLHVLAEGAGRRRLPLMGAAAASSASTSTPGQAWPAYDWMGVAKAGLESGPVPGPRPRAEGDPGRTWSRPARSARWPRSRSPASVRSRTPGRSGRRSAGTPATRRRSPRPCVALLSDWFPATSGSMVMVDGGFSALGFSSRRDRRMVPPSNRM